MSFGARVSVVINVVNKVLSNRSCIPFRHSPLCH